MATTHDPLAPSTAQTSGSTIDSMKEKLSDAASHLRDTASQYGSAAADNIDRNIHSAAGAVKSTAETLRSQVGGSAGGKMADMAHSAADKLDTTAQYFSEFDTRQMIGQMEDWTRRNPTLAICCAAATGFLIGMSLRRDHSSY